MANVIGKGSGSGLAMVKAMFFEAPMLKVVDVPFLVRNFSRGKNARLVVWRNVLRLVTQETRGEPAFSVLAG